MSTRDSGLTADWIRKHYHEYLQTEHWQDVKRRYRESKLNEHGCYVCHTQAGLQLHHKTYKRVGRERLTDLIYLCDDCHREAHGLLRKEHSQNLNLWNAARRLARLLFRRTP